MQRQHRFLTYATPFIAQWINAHAEQRRVSSSIVVGDCIVDTWQCDTQADLRTLATDPVRQNTFITVALDALLTHHAAPDWREQTVAA